MLQHVLTVLAFWSWVLLLPRLPPWFRSLRLFPSPSILLYGPFDIVWICCPQLPHHPCKNGTHSTCFYSTGGHTPNYERRRKSITEIHADLFFQACISFLRCFRTPVAPTREILVHTGMLPCLALSWPQIMQIRIVLISFWMLTMPWIFCPISFCRLVSRFALFQTKMAHLCFCLVRIKMPLLICLYKVYTSNAQHDEG